MPHPDPDPALLSRWLAGDPGAFDALVRGWERPVGRLLARLTGCPDAARDLTQEVFLRVYRSAGGYADDGRFKPWLFRIAVNLARDAARRAARRPESPLHDTDPPAKPAPAGGPAEERELADAVAGALAELPLPLREVVVLRHYEGLSFEAMARLLDVPATTLKSRFAVAMTKLRESLTARGFGPEV
ncbi:MAG: sigma-70 family RNA polymerase sigma factor [Gemmataceae bacterium]